MVVVGKRKNYEAKVVWGLLELKLGGLPPISMAAAYTFSLNVAISHYWNPKMWQAVTEKK